MPQQALNATRDMIIKSALRKVGAYSSINNPKPSQIEDANIALEMFIKSLQMARYLWVREWVTIFCEQGVNKYIIPGASIVTGIFDPPYAHAATEYQETTILTAAVAFPAVQCFLTSTSDITANDLIGILLDDGSVHWDVVDVIISTTEVTLRNGIPTVAAVGKDVWSYHPSQGAKKTIEVSTATRKTYNGNEIQLIPITRKDYADQVNKTNQGIPVNYYHDEQKETSVIYVWPTPSSDTQQLIMTFDRPLYFPVDATDPIDFPDDFTELLVWGLAARIAPEYGVDLNERTKLEQQYAALFANVGQHNQDDESVFLQPGRN